MSEAEAIEILDEMKAGKKISTRFQEESWGFSYKADDQFHYWTDKINMEDGSSEGVSEIWEIEWVCSRLMLYSKEVIRANLR